MQGSLFDGELRQGSLKMSAFSGKIDGIPVILLRPDWSATNLFQGSRIYGGSYNETEAYLFFSRQAYQAIPHPMSLKSSPTLLVQNS